MQNILVLIHYVLCFKLAQQGMTIDASDRFLSHKNNTVRKFLVHSLIITQSNATAPAIHQTVLIPKRTDQHSRSMLSPCSPESEAALYPQELLGCCQVKKEVLCRRREIMLL